jgi:hypothetical protein
MSCPEFENRGLLYNSGELSPSERMAYEKHIEQCQECREELELIEETLNLMRRLSFEKPGSKIRKVILQQARRKKTESSPWEKIRSWFITGLPYRGLAWGLSTAVVALFFILVIIRPFGRVGPLEGAREDLLSWEDDFIAEVDWIESEIDRVESGALLVSYVSSDDEDLESEGWLSPMSRELDWIRGKVEDLVKNIYGI